MSLSALFSWQPFSLTTLEFASLLIDITTIPGRTRDGSVHGFQPCMRCYTGRGLQHKACGPIPRTLPKWYIHRAYTVRKHFQSRILTFWRDFIDLNTVLGSHNSKGSPTLLWRQRVLHHSMRCHKCLFHCLSGISNHMSVVLTGCSIVLATGRHLSLVSS